MSTTFTPTISSEPIRVVEIKTATRIIDMPPVGSLMRATLGDTSILFRLNRVSDTIPAFHGDIVGPGHDGYRDITFWPEIPWKFEILDQIEATA